MSTKELVKELVTMVEGGRLLEAFDRFYGEDVTMAENQSPPTVGKAANRTREEAFLASVKEVHVVRAPSILVDGDQAAVRWVMEFTNTEGTRLKFDQVALQQWQDGLIVRETFYYDPTALVQAG